jgi:tRNA(His) guanylyltransferase
MATKPRRDALGDRMKRYEEATRFVLPRRTYTILRVDGRAFHTWTRGLDKPYDKAFMSCMNAAAIRLCETISGSQFAYVQSDEISVLAVDFLDIATEPWFDGNIQKWASVSAATAAAAFNERVGAYNAARDTTTLGARKRPTAAFDARVFTIPDPIEVENYFVWRQQDAERNSVAMLAQSHYSHKQLAGKKRADQHELIHKAGDNWAKHPVRFKHGAVVRHEKEKFDSQYAKEAGIESITYSNWVVDEKTPVFTKERHYLRELVPIIWDDDLLVRKAASNG